MQTIKKMVEREMPKMAYEKCGNILRKMPSGRRWFCHGPFGALCHDYCPPTQVPLGLIDQRRFTV